ARYRGDASGAPGRLYGAGDSVDELGPVVYSVQSSVAVLVFREVFRPKALRFRIARFQFQILERYRRRLVGGGVDEIEVHGQHLITRTVDDAKCRQSVQLADGLTDRYLVTTHDTNVGREKRDNAPEVDIFRVLNSEIYL